MNSEATPTYTQNQAALELVFAGSLWGFGFVATVWALDAMGPLALTGWRFVVAAAVGCTLSYVIPARRIAFTWEQFRLARTSGLLLSGLLITQCWGQRYTTATKSGFITTLYVLIVPLLERVLYRKRLSGLHYAAVAVALIGAILICDLPALWAARVPGLDPKVSWNFGDFLTLIAALFASVHILWFEVIRDRIRDPFVFNGFQSIWAGAIPLVLSFFFEPWPHFPFSSAALIGFVSLSLGSTLVAFALQVRAQKVLSPSLASLLFLLESPFATLFAILLLGESLKALQWVGGGLILLAAGISTALATETE